MVKVSTLATSAVAGLLFQGVQCHGDVSKELRLRADFKESLGPRAINACAAKLKARGISDKLAARRNVLINEHRVKRGLAKRNMLEPRDFEKVLSTNHRYNGTDITPESSALEIFGSNNETVLAPETTEGPYYVSGELIRSNVVEDEEGVDLITDIQFIDVNTCEPLPAAAIDFWHCNATGVYGGVSGGGFMSNGNGDDATIVNKTALRGIQITDEDGVVTFVSKFPGHYIGRATHIHVMTHLDYETLPNNRISGGNVSHVGQLFFDQSLISEVEANEPYVSNTQPLTTNARDMIMSQTAAGQHDPVMEYVYLGDKAADGIFAWITIGVDTNYRTTPHAAAECDDDGCKLNADGGFPGFPGGGFPGGFPTDFAGFPGGFPTDFPGFPGGFPTGFPGFPGGFPGGMPSGFPGGFPGRNPGGVPSSSPPLPSATDSPAEEVPAVGQEEPGEEEQPPHHVGCAA